MDSSPRAAWLSAATSATFAAIMLLTSQPVRADVYWSASSGDWSVASNWGGTLPSSSGMAYIANGGTVTVTNGTQMCADLFLEHGAVYQSAGSLTLGDELSDWTSGSLIYNINGGTLAGTLAYYSGSIVQSGGVVSLTGAGSSGAWIGGGRGPGYYTIGAGTLQASYVSVGATAGGVGTMTVSNSTGHGITLVSVTGTNGMDVGGGAVGTLNISGGTVQIPNGPITVGTSANAPSTVNQSGGLVTAEKLLFGRSWNSSGTYNLDGGELSVSSIGLNQLGLAGTFSFGGGTLQANTLFSSSQAMTLTGIGGNATVDTNGFPMVLSGQLSGPGGLTKVDSGTLTLTGTNTYTGPTTVKQGLLVVDSALPDSVLAVNSGGLLGGSGSLTSATVNSGGTLAPGSPLGEMQISGSLSLLAGAKMDYELDTLLDSSEVFMPSGVLELSGQQFSDFNFTALGGFGQGTYDLIDAGSITGSLGSGTNGIVDGLPASIAVEGNEVVLNVVPEPGTLALLGVGAIMLVGCTWRTRGCNKGASGRAGKQSVRANRATAVPFLNVVAVSFTLLSAPPGSAQTSSILVASGTHTMSYPVVVVGNLSVVPSAGAELIITGNISEMSPGASLALNGPGTLSLDGSNTYTGLTTVNQGYLLVDGSVGSSLTVNSGGTAGGTGSVTNVTVESGGELSPGDPLAGPTGTLQLSGGLTLLPGATVNCRLDTPSDSSQVSMTSGALALGGQQFSDFNFTPLGGFGQGTYDLINAGQISGSLGSGTSGIVDGLPASIAVEGNEVVLNVVPEPGTLALLAATSAGLILIARGRRNVLREVAPPASCDDVPPATLSFPSRCSSAQAIRRAA